MPELPEVEITRRGIEPRAAGRRIAAVHVYDARLRWPVPFGLAAAIEDASTATSTHSSTVMVER